MVSDIPMPKERSKRRWFEAAHSALRSRGRYSSSRPSGRARPAPHNTHHAAHHAAPRTTHDGHATPYIIHAHYCPTYATPQLWGRDFPHICTF